MLYYLNTVKKILLSNSSQPSNLNLKQESRDFFDFFLFVCFCLQAGEEELQKDVIDQMVWTPENLAGNAFSRINMYKDTMLRPLEVGHAGLQKFYMA